jgi:dynein heavy chain 1
MTDSTVMAASSQELEDTLFQDTSFDEKAQRFATDPGSQVVYITKERFVDAEDGE